MKLTRVAFLWILAQTVSGESRAVCPNPTVEAVEGDSVSLLCRLDPPDSVVNNAVDWKKVDLNTVVYAYRNKKENQKDQVAEYRGRANVSLEGLNAGNMTLWISSLKTSDSGPYRCFTSKLMTSCKVSLTVVPKAQQNGTKREDFSTTAPPTHDDEPGAENVKHDRHIISTIVGVSIFVVIIIVVVLVRRGTIQRLIRKLRRGTRQNAEQANGRELKHLKTPTNDDEDPTSADSRNNEQEV